MHLEEYIPRIYLDSAIREGLVSNSTDDTGLLAIYNYTPKAMFTPGAWNNPAVRKSRGLIVDVNSQEIIARPWEKFLNWGQPEAEISLDSAVEVTDKADGSLGIIYYHPYLKKLMVATRGSFNSVQAQHANEILDKHLSPLKSGFLSTNKITPLVEIIYPENRIVVDYGTTDALVLLGAVTEKPLNWLGTDSTYIGPHNAATLIDWEGPVTESLGYMTVKEALELPPRNNAEGLCLRYIHGDSLIKVKQEDYVALHKLVTGLNEKAVWERLVAEPSPNGLGKLLEPLPDELHAWTRKVWYDFVDKANDIESNARAELMFILSNYFGGKREAALNDRAKFASFAAKSPNSKYLFLLLDDRDIYPVIIKSLKPTGENRAKSEFAVSTLLSAESFLRNRKK